MRFALSLWLAAMAVAAAASGAPAVRYLGQAKYLNGMKAVATHSIDDTTPTVSTALEVIDRCGIKATIFVNTAREPIDKLWPRLRQAIAEGHEIGAHGRTHPCAWPPNESSAANTMQTTKWLDRATTY